MFKKIEDQLAALSKRRATSLRINNLIVGAGEDRLPRSGVVRVGIPSMIGIYLFPRLIRMFCAKYPQYELSIVEDGTVSILQLLQEGKLDIGFVVLFGESPEGLEVLPIASGNMMVCVPEGHKLASLPAIPMEALKDEPTIMLKRGTHIRQMILEQAEKKGFSSNIIFSTSQVQTIVKLVSEGVGITFLLDIIAHNQPEIVCKPLEEPVLVNMGLVWPKDQNMSEATRALVEVVKEAFADSEIKALYAEQAPQCK